MINLSEIRYDVVDYLVTNDEAALLELCVAVFPSFKPAYLIERIPKLTDLLLCRAYVGGTLVGMKLGYRRGAQLFYSWLGGVRSKAQRSGVAAALMELQHKAVAERGYRIIETRTRASNNAMMVLNLRSKFHVCGFEVDVEGNAIVTQRKSLKP